MAAQNGITVNISVDQAVQKLRSSFQDVEPRKFKKAMGMAINEQLKYAATESVRSIREEYPELKYRMLKRDMKQTKRASANSPSAIMIIAGKPHDTSALPLKVKLQPFTWTFRGKQYTMPREKISFKLKGKWHELGSSFRIKTNGKTLVTARGAYAGSYVWRKERIQKKGPDTPVTAIQTLSTPGAASTKKVNTRIQDRINKDFERRATSILNHVLSKVR